MDMSRKKKIGLTLLLVYAFSVAIFLTTMVNAQGGSALILQVVNPVTGQNLAWGRENITLESEYGAVQNLSLTYIPQTAIQVTFKVNESYIDNYKFNTSSTSNYTIKAEEFGINIAPLTPGVTYAILSRFMATTNETTIISNITPYAPKPPFYYVQFNDTPPTPFYFTYSSTDTLNGTLYANYANVTATISQIPIEVQNLGINSGVVVNVTIQPVLKNLPSKNVVNISFSVKLNYTKVGNEYLVNASYYVAPNTHTYQFLNYLVDAVTSVPGTASQTEGITVPFHVYGIGYVLLVDLGLWSNTTTVYVKGINPTPSYNNASFRPVIIPPSMNVVYSMFGQGNEVLANVTDNYMIANITIYAPDDILDWYLSTPNGGPMAAYAYPYNEPNDTGKYAGLYLTLYVNGNAVKSMNVPLELYYTGSGYVPYVFKAYVSFLLSPTNNIEVAPNALGSVSNSSVVYVFINPADLKNAMIMATFNDSDYAVQYYFGPIGRASVSENLPINVTAPVIQLPSVASLSQSYIPGNLTDYDYGYHYVVENVTTVMPKYPVLISPQGSSEIIIGQTTSPTEASVTLYYPNTPPYYNPSHEVQVGMLTSVTIKFQNGTTYKIYLTSTNISRLFTSYTWYQVGNVPLQLWQYGFEISLPGLEQILGITSQQAIYVLNNSVLSINYYDTITGQTITKNIKLVSLPIELQLIPPNQGKIPIQTIGTPIADLQPGVNLLYNVTATTGFAVEVELSDPTYGQTAPGTILTVPVTNITIIGWTGVEAKLLYPVNSTLVLTETAPGSGLFVGYIVFNVSPLGAPINETTLYVDHVPVGTLSQYIEYEKSMTIIVTITGLEPTPLVESVNITGELYTNVFENVTPLVYNPVTNQLSFYMKATIPYNYSGYVAIQIVNASGVTVFVYETFFQPLPNETMNELIAFDLSLAHLAPGTYKVYVSAFTIPVVYPSTAVAPTAKPIEVDFVMTQLTIT